MYRILAALLLSIICAAANASVVFFAVAVAADEAELLVKDEPRILEALERSNGSVLALDKAWHGLHFLLTGSASSTDGPMGQAILGGRAVGKDFGYGPARIVSAGQVRSIARALQGLNPAALAGKYDPQAMQHAEVYPSIWTREGQEGFRFLMNYLPALQAFYEKAAESGLAVVVVLR